MTRVEPWFLLTEIGGGGPSFVTKREERREYQSHFSDGGALVLLHTEVPKASFSRRPLIRIDPVSVIPGPNLPATEGKKKSASVVKTRDLW